jgi:hypothetical protein
VDVWLLGAGNRKTNRFGPGCEQQPVILQPLSTRKKSVMCVKIEPDDTFAEPDFDAIPLIKGLIPQRHIVQRDCASEIVLRQIWTVIGWRSVATEHD